MHQRICRTAVHMAKFTIAIRHIAHGEYVAMCEDNFMLNVTHSQICTGHLQGHLCEVWCLKGRQAWIKYSAPWA